MRAAWILVIGLITGCGNTVVVVCDVDEFAQADVAGRSEIMNCDEVLQDPDAGSGSGAWAPAQACVLDAVAAKQAFIFVYDVPDPVYGQHLRAAYTGYPTGNGRLAVHAYAFSGDRPMIPGDSNPSVSSLACNSDPPLAATDDCTPDVGHPCLDCKSTARGALLCGFQP